MKLSVIIPVYNVEKYLRKCLDSVIYPELCDYEIVIVNDGSTDLSPTIAEEYCQRFPTFCRMITTPNGGLGHARNVGLDAAAGEYVLFLDSDDYLSDKALLRIIDLLSEPFDIYSFGLISVTESGKELSFACYSAPEGSLSLSSHPLMLSEFPCACGKIFRRSLFINSGILFPSRVWYEDLRTIPKLYIYAETIINRPHRWYYYVQRSGSITNSVDAQRNLEIIDAVDDLLGFYKAAGKYDEYRDALEFAAFYHELLVATTRVNLIDRKSTVQETLLSDFLSKYPNYKSNPHVLSLSFKHKLLLFFIERRMYLCLHIVMKLNNALKGKNS